MQNCSDTYSKLYFAGGGVGPTNNPGAGALSDPVGNPPRSKVKGHKKEKD
jgi:hypothetical protein